MSRNTEPSWAVRVAAALEDAMRTRRVREVETAEWVWLEIELHDERWPLTIDILGSKHAAPSPIVYMLPGGGANFRATFLSPFDRNLAQFVRKRGALVIGVSSREDNVPRDLKDYGFMARWGLDKHRADLRAVVTRVQAAGPVPYELIGHSYGAALALDYAAHHAAELRRVVALDIYSLDPASAACAQAERTCAAYAHCLQEHRYHDLSYAGLKRAVAAANRAPAATTAFSREHFGHPGNFSAQGALDFSLVHTASLPGMHTPLSGLSGDWPLNASLLAGSFQFADDPRQDAATFTHTSVASLREAAGQLGTGVVPVALARDYWAVNAGNAAYTLAWEAITAPVVWLNASLGYGDKQWGAEVMRRAGNRSVDTRVIAGYGHCDLLWADGAPDTVWQPLSG